MSPSRPRRPVPAPAQRASRYVRSRAAQERSPAQRARDIMAERGLSPRRRFGQNFLVREDIAERIVEHAHVREDDVVVEIGPGTGALTPHLAARARHVVAVEKDAGLADYLKEEYDGLARLTVVEGDFLDTDVASIAAAHGAEKVLVVGNIPYNITTPLLERVFEQRAVVRAAVLLVQKEYADRLGAAAGTPEYGALTLFARYHAMLEPLMTVRATAFWPRPEVDSMLVRFFMRDRAPVEVPSEALLFRIIRGAFQMRRKQLINTLERSLDLPKVKIERLCRHATIAPERRGETLTLDEFAKLARAAADYVDEAGSS